MYRGERFNSISHLVGAVLALAGLVVLVVLASLHGGVTRVASVAVYGTSLLLLYTVSTLYHSLKGRAKVVFQRLDHTAIYLLIAGTYTPFALLVIKGGARVVDVRGRLGPGGRRHAPGVPSCEG